MPAVYTVGWEDDRLPLPSQFARPAAPVNVTACLGPRLDPAVWIDASQGSQRLPIKVAPAVAPNAAVGPDQAYLKSIEYLKGVVEHPSQFVSDEESDSLPAASEMDFGMELADNYEDSQIEEVSAEDVQEGAVSDGSQRAESDASSGEEQPEDGEELEAVEQRPAKRHPCLYAECDYSANRRSHLTVHLRTHSEEKPYACERCEYRSTNSSNLYRHIRRNH